MIAKMSIPIHVTEKYRSESKEIQETQFPYKTRLTNVAKQFVESWKTMVLIQTRVDTFPTNSSETNFNYNFPGSLPRALTSAWLLENPTPAQLSDFEPARPHWALELATRAHLAPLGLQWGKII